ncbi:MAG: acyl-[Lachnospiraceae bacterium]|nr:acyl-[acyl-carrier-protein] thioesterase [Lachnospiraceae bacterium]
MYKMEREITYSQVRQDLKIDMAEIAQFFQDCVLVQSEIIGRGVGYTTKAHRAWFLSSWQIEVDRYPEFMEHIVVRTWPYEFKSMYGYRNFEMIDAEGKQIARANSIWLHMDVENMRPIKPTEEDVKGYDLEPAIEMEYAPRKIKMLGEECRQKLLSEEPVVVKRSFLDSNNHVNNGRYVKESMDYLPEDKVITKLRVDYRKAATLSDKMYPSVYVSGDICQVVFADAERSPFVIVEVM